MPTWLSAASSVSSGSSASRLPFSTGQYPDWGLKTPWAGRWTPGVGVPGLSPAQRCRESWVLGSPDASLEAARSLPPHSKAVVLIPARFTGDTEALVGRSPGLAARLGPYQHAGNAVCGHCKRGGLIVAASNVSVFSTFFTLNVHSFKPEKQTNKNNPQMLLKE